MSEAREINDAALHAAADVFTRRPHQPHHRASAREPIANSNARMITVLLAIVTSAPLGMFGSYLVNRALTEYRLAELEKVTTRHEGALSDMELNGHPDHERRIAKLEGVGADRTAMLVVEQGKQISELAGAVRQDHDVLVRLVTLADKDRK